MTMDQPLPQPLPPQPPSDEPVTQQSLPQQPDPQQPGSQPPVSPQQPTATPPLSPPPKPQPWRAQQPVARAPVTPPAAPPEVSTVNPLFSIWLHPRRTIRHIVETNAARGVLVLAALVSAAQLVMQTATPGATVLPVRISIPVAAGGGAVIGILALYFFGWLYARVGSWFGGTAESEQVRAAIAWAEVPILIPFLVWLGMYATSLLKIVLPIPTAFVYGLASTVFSLWSFVLSCHTLGEVHEFSAWKALFAMIVGGLLAAIPVVLLTVALAVALPGMLKGKRSQGSSKAPVQDVMDKIASREIAVTQQTEAGESTQTTVKFEDLIRSGARLQFKLKGGKELKGTILEEYGQDIFVDTAEGVMNIPKSSIVDVQKEKATP